MNVIEYILYAEIITGDGFTIGGGGGGSQDLQSVLQYGNTYSSGGAVLSLFSNTILMTLSFNSTSIGVGTVSLTNSSANMFINTEEIRSTLNGNFISLLFDHSNGTNHSIYFREESGTVAIRETLYSTPIDSDIYVSSLYRMGVFGGSSIGIADVTVGNLVIRDTEFVNTIGANTYRMRFDTISSDIEVFFPTLNGTILTTGLFDSLIPYSISLSLGNSFSVGNTILNDGTLTIGIMQFSEGEIYHQIGGTDYYIQYPSVLANSVIMTLPSESGTVLTDASLQNIVRYGTVSLVSGTATVSDPRITAASYVSGIALSNIGTYSSVPITWSASSGAITFSTNQASDTVLFGYTIVY